MMTSDAAIEWVVSSPCAAVEATSKEISWLRYFFLMVSRHKVAIVVKMQMEKLRINPILFGRRIYNLLQKTISFA
jgi:hypothetical protein